MTFSSVPPSADKGRRVLVVDDYPDSADMLAEALQDLGHRVAVAHDAETALVVADNFSPQIAILDLRLPQMDGFELAGKLKASHGAGMVLVAMTGLSRAEERSKATQVGFEHYFVKPIDLEKLQELFATLAR
jgi:DNA-binding response OmpR family regulator